MKKEMKKGFTLIEMLVVLGIISVISGALMVGYGRVSKSAQRARAQETVSNVATALNMILQQKNTWPADNDRALIRFHGKDGSDQSGCRKEVATVFYTYKLLGVAMSNGQPSGTDRCGIVDPWAVAVLKRNKSNGASTAVPTGGTVKDHVIYYALDTDFDGITEAKVCGEQVKVRASAIAWCAGADGKLGEGYSKRSKANSDNIYSWRRNQEVKK